MGSVRRKAAPWGGGGAVMLCLVHWGGVLPAQWARVIIHSLCSTRISEQKKLTNQFATEEEISPPNREKKRHKANHLWPALLIRLVKGYRCDSFRGMK